jgi:protein-S-isoprenylcysteine O-methyltransferase Ste14
VRVLFDAVRASFYSMLFVLLWGYLALGVRKYDPALGGQLPAWMYLLGIACMASGAAFALMCIGTFVVRGRGTPAPFDAPLKLVAVGIYRWVRNPMYLSGCMVMIGYALYARSAAVLLLAAGMWIAEHIFVLLYEEPTLREKFDGSYEEYCRTVSRWLPRPPHGQTS